MVQDAPNPSPDDADADADHPPSPPSRLVSKHRPRRRATAPLPPPPPPPPSPPPAAAAAAARGEPDLTHCDCCGTRFPAPHQPGSKGRRVVPLRSLWRVVLLCDECLSLVRSAAVCSYCLSLDDLPPEDSSSSATCLRCARRVHRRCIPGEHRAALVQPVDVDRFVCVDCCPTVKPRGAKKCGCADEYAVCLPAGEDPGGKIKANSAARKSAEASKLGSKLVDAEPLPDGEVALQLHRSINGSPRISRSRSASDGGLVGQGRRQRSALGGTKDSGDQGLCVTNMMDHLDADAAAVEPVHRTAKRVREQLDPEVTIVFALPCPGSELAQRSLRGKKKGPPVTKKENCVVDRYKKKYSKRKSKIQPKTEHTETKTLPGRTDMDGDDGGSGIAPMS